MLLHKNITILLYINNMFGQVTTYQSIRPRQRVGYCIARHQQSSEFRPGRNNDFESNGIVGVQ